MTELDRDLLTSIGSPEAAVACAHRDFHAPTPRSEPAMPGVDCSTAGEASWTSIADDGRGGAGEAVDLSQDDRDDDLHIELHTDMGQVASAVVKVEDVWAVSGPSHRHHF